VTWRKIQAWYTKIPYSLKIAVLVALVAKLAVFIVGYATAYLGAAAMGGSTQPFGLFVGMFDKWDAPHYIYLAQHWYTNQGDAANLIVFFPFYPILIRLITFNFSYTSLSALIVANVASIAAVVYLFKLVKLDYSDSVAKKAVLFLVVFPTAYFMSAPYTESIFLALAIASLYYARYGRWALAASLGFFASLTRITGLILVPVLAVEYFHQKNWKLKMADLRLLWLSLPAIGFLVYLGINFEVTGNLFAFIRIQDVHFYESFQPLAGWISALSWASNSSYPSSLTIGYAEIVFAVFSYLMIVLAYMVKLRPSYLVYMLLAWMVALAPGFWISVPRYILCMFPLFLALGLVSTKKSVTIAIVAVFAAGLLFFTWLFATGAWAF